MIVVDTNVVVQFVAAGDETIAAARLYRGDSAWSAPPILMSELRNVLVGLVRRGEITEGHAEAMNDDASAIIGDRIVAVSGRQTIAAALECSLTGCDAEFVVLARRLRVPLATLDRAVLSGAPDVAVPPAVLAERLEGASPEHFQ